jgi:hypothetical protein
MEVASTRFKLDPKGSTSLGNMGFSGSITMIRNGVGLSLP